MKITYESTRLKEKATPSEAVLKGIASDGGLYVPDHLPEIDINSLQDCSYKEICFRILKEFFHTFDESRLREMIDLAYSKFTTPEVAPVSHHGDYHFLELYHGPTFAFKDVALSILPLLLTESAKEERLTDEIVILTATSGDTGKAALEGFSGVKGTRIVVFYPQEGVSDIQKKQMTTQDGENVHVFGIDGNFDDAQTGVKEIFSDQNFNGTLKERHAVLSSANSINIGRLVPQIVYYFTAYFEGVKNGFIALGDEINFTVPTGNFGNILAGYYAKQMGLPIKKLICASNANNVLSDFFTSGSYDKNRPFLKTMSPSMDILISSNFERLLYHVSGRDETFVRQAMTSLSQEGKYQVSPSMKKDIDENFYGSFCSEEETAQTIKSVYDTYRYVMDPHTAVACKVYDDYVKDRDDRTYNVILSTASPFKFTKSVYQAMFGPSEADDFTLLEKLSEKTLLDAPGALSDLYRAEDLHRQTCPPEKMKECVLDVLS